MNATYTDTLTEVEYLHRLLWCKLRNLEKLFSTITDKRDIVTYFDSILVLIARIEQKEQELQP